MSTVVGVDVGTSVTKAVAFDGNGRALASASRPSRLDVASGGRVEQDLDEVTAGVGEVVREVAASLGRTPDAVALTGQGDGLWLRDQRGRPVRPAISWMDARASALVTRWLADGTIRTAYAHTGSGMFPGCHGPLLNWLREHEPESLDRAAVAGYCVDAVAQRLTGQVCLDASDATLPFLDPRTRVYAPAALEACGVADQARLLPLPAAPGTVLGLDGRGAGLLGLPEGLPVVAGPYDLPACAIGSGVREVGDGVLILGTTLASQVLTDRVDLDPLAEPAGMWLCTPAPGQWLRAMPAMVGTAALEWVLALVGATTADLDALLTESPPGARGVRAFPFLSEAGERAPFVEPSAQGRLDGLSLATGRADAVRAVCEAIGYAARHCLETAGLSGTLALCGGGARSAMWARLIADVLGRPVRIPLEEQVGALGVVSVARASLSPGYRAPVPPGEAVDPREDLRALYEDGYARYRAELGTARGQWAAGSR
ncbi:Erythritol kinase [Streptomyces sp. ADI96-02]|uniref:FGGY-family carbohydrate kinase n=1 Tax=unclassified Streptomyces TaxID=2593676 RepID=UPI000F54FCF5|nr:FGGY-family carbohydrate kinase [Streptomyces sp. ADI96-02]RPK54855.1 Erythritol kinase [Streptomyces sp. ADI96-02]